jgi:Protein of unknown function (DUF3098)
MKENNKGISIFTKENYIWMLAGLVVIALGFLLMAGGKSADPTKFNNSDVYSFRRITLAPLLIIAGFVLEIVGIMKKPKLAND